MKNKTILFDLDSTLLQMNQDLFLKKYFALIYKKASELGYDADSFMKIFSKAAFSIISNDGSMTNESLFWGIMEKYYPNIDELKEQFNSFYENEFSTLSSIVNKSSTSNDIIQCLKKKGYTLILATNPLFPRVCTVQRMKWAGLNPDDFVLITTYENSRYCKPNHLYYEEIFKNLNIPMDGAIMVGNDLSDDFSDIPEGISKILITDYLINKNNAEIDMPSFQLNEFLEYVKEEM